MVGTAGSAPGGTVVSQAIHLAIVGALVPSVSGVPLELKNPCLRRRLNGNRALLESDDLDPPKPSGPESKERPGRVPGTGIGGGVLIRLSSRAVQNSGELSTSGFSGNLGVLRLLPAHRWLLPAVKAQKSGFGETPKFNALPTQSLDFRYSM